MPLYSMIFILQVHIFTKNSNRFVISIKNRIYRHLCYRHSLNSTFFFPLPRCDIFYLPYDIVFDHISSSLLSYSPSILKPSMHVIIYIHVFFSHFFGQSVECVCTFHRIKIIVGIAPNNLICTFLTKKIFRNKAWLYPENIQTKNFKAFFELKYLDLYISRCSF